MTYKLEILYCKNGGAALAIRNCYICREGLCINCGIYEKGKYYCEECYPQAKTASMDRGRRTN